MSQTEKQTPRRQVLVAKAKQAKNLDPITYVLGTAILIALLLVLLVNGREAQGDESQTITSARRGVVELTSSGSGSIEPARNTDLDFETSGKVVEVYVEAGDKVKKGDPIARLDRRSAELAVEEAEANLEDAENGTSATTGVSYTDDGDSVQTSFAVYTGGSVSSTMTALSDTGVSQAPTTTEGTGTTDQAEETTTGPTGPTGPTGTTGPTGPSTPAVPDNELPEDDGGLPSESDGNTAMPSVSGGMSGGSMGGGSTSGGSTGGETSETAIARAELDLEEAESALAATVLRAPYAGTIVSISGAVGDSVSGESTTSGSTSSSGESTGSASSAAPTASGSSSGSSGESTAFAVLQQLDALEMEVSVSEADINQIHAGQRATVTISSADDEQLAATVNNVGLLASTDSSGVVTYPVTVRIDQHSDLVKPGMSATVSIVIDQVSGAVTVPNQALSGNTVQVVEGDSTKAQTVETGLVGDSTTEILDGLEDGQEIAIPQAQISDVEMPSGAGEMGGLPSGMSGGAGGFPGGGSMPSPPSGGFPGG